MYQREILSSVPSDRVTRTEARDAASVLTKTAYGGAKRGGAKKKAYSGVWERLVSRARGLSKLNERIQAAAAGRKSAKKRGGKKRSAKKGGRKVAKRGGRKSRR